MSYNTISNVNTNAVASTNKVATNENTTQNDVKEETFVNENEDTAAIYQPGGRSEVSSSDLNKIDKFLEDDKNSSAKRLANMVSKVLGQQIEETESTSTLSDILGVESTEETEEAQTTDDYYSVEATSGRLLDFAKALSGGDAEKFESLRSAVQAGFEDAATSMGFDSIDDMPQITRDTYAATMAGFDKGLEA